MDITTDTQAPLAAFSAQETPAKAASSKAFKGFRLDAASWMALAVFVAYVGIGIFA